MEEEIKTKIIELKKKKKEIDIEIRKLEQKSKNKNGSSNTLIRVANKFKTEIEDIQEKRIELGLDDEPISKPKITELLIKHKLWPDNIKSDIINFNPNINDGDNSNVIYKK